MSDHQLRCARNVILFSISQRNFYFEPSFCHVAKTVSVILSFIPFPQGSILNSWGWDISSPMVSASCWTLLRCPVLCPALMQVGSYLPLGSHQKGTVRAGASCHFCAFAGTEAHSAPLHPTGSHTGVCIRTTSRARYITMLSFNNNF